MDTPSHNKVMWRRGREPDPTTDHAASDVLAAFEGAEGAGLPPIDCYRAAVDAWQRAHPHQTRAYAARKAVAVILASKVSLRIEDESESR